MNLNSEHYDLTKLSTVLSVLMSQKSQNQNVGQNIITLVFFKIGHYAIQHPVSKFASE